MKLTDVAQNHSQPHSQTRPTLYLPIGPSGSGKSTYYRKLKEENPNLQSFSLDQLRLDWYGTDDYAKAWEIARDDKTFKERANKVFFDLIKTHKDLYLDNTNLTVKRRRFYIDHAKKQGYKTVGIVLPAHLETLIGRQTSRSDKHVPEKAVRHQFGILQQPAEGEFDEVINPKGA